MTLSAQEEHSTDTLSAWYQECSLQKKNQRKTITENQPLKQQCTQFSLYWPVTLEIFKSKL